MSNMIEENEFDNTELGRKVEFDKGIPLSMDYPDNSVSSVDINIFSIVKRILKKVYSRPTYFLMFILYIFYIIAICINYSVVTKLEM